MKSNENPDFDLAPLAADDSAQLKRKLAWRMGIASVMILVLLGGLALFDYLATRPEEPEPAPYFTEPVPVARESSTQATGPVVPAPEEGTEGTEGQGPSVPETTEVPAEPAAVDTTSPPSPPPPPQPSPEVASSAASNAASPPAARPPARSTPAVPSPAGRGEQRKSPAEAVPARTDSSRPSAPETAATPAPALPPARPTGQTEPKGRQTESYPPRPAAPETPAKSAPASPPPVLTRLLSGYTLQAGVFADPRRAEDVHAKLVQEGIPATLETRVLVGPFKNRNEAESARAKMKAMGIDALPVPRSGGK